jgi:lipopolysaccharide biosynthesis glycosyltransferase
MNPLVLALDDNYVLQLKVLWHSLYQTSSIPKALPIYILHESTLSQVSIEDLKDFFSVFHYAPVFLDIEQQVPSDLPISESDHVTRATFYRLYLPSILPQEVNSVVYLDVDTLAIDSIRALFTSSLGDSLLGAVDHFSPHEELRLWGDVGGTYFNAGVLLINLQMWRHANVETIFQEILRSQLSRLRWWDQDVLNIAFKDQWQRIPMWFNSHFSVLQLAGLSSIKSNAKLIHYTGATKPWNNQSPHQVELLWHKSKSDLSEYISLECDLNTAAEQGLESLTIFDTREELVCSCLRDDMVVSEIGVFEGEFSEFLLSAARLQEFYIVDLFDGVVGSGDKNGNDYKEIEMSDVYAHLLRKYRSSETVTVYKGSSQDFFRHIPDDTLDFVYIDGDHTYEGCRSDLENAYAKVKKGGYILGHDYSFNPFKTENTYDFGVKKAVDHFCESRRQAIFAKALDGCVSYAIKLSK